MRNRPGPTRAQTSSPGPGASEIAAGRPTRVRRPRTESEPAGPPPFDRGGTGRRSRWPRTRRPRRRGPGRATSAGPTRRRSGGSAAGSPGTARCPRCRSRGCPRVQPQRADGDARGQASGSEVRRQEPSACRSRRDTSPLVATHSASSPAGSIAADSPSSAGWMRSGRAGRRRSGPAPAPARPTARLRVGSRRRPSLRAGPRGGRRAAGIRIEPVAPDAPGLPCASIAKSWSGRRRPRRRRAAMPAAVRPPGPPVGRLAVDAAGRVDQQLERLDRAPVGGGTQQRARPPSTRPRWPCWVRNRNDSRRRPPPARRSGSPAAPRRGHVEDPEAMAVEAHEPAEGREPHLAAGQDDDVGDGVLGQPCAVVHCTTR